MNVINHLKLDRHLIWNELHNIQSFDDIINRSTSAIQQKRSVIRLKPSTKKQLFIV